MDDGNDDVVRYSPCIICSIKTLIENDTQVVI